MKCTIVIQSKNSFDYLALFLAHHERLADRIVIIDHNSDRDLRGLRSDKIEVYRLGLAAYMQAHTLNFLLHTVLQVTRESGMLFILDVDEFLPFSSRSDMDAFVADHRKDAIVSFRWRNGYAPEPGQLVDPSGIRFCRQRTPTRKLAYNLDKLGLFFPLGGNHEVRLARPFWRRRGPTVDVVDSGLGLLHLPFVGLEGLRQKVRDNPAHEFAGKISANYRLLGLKEDRPWAQDAVSEEVMLQLIANYRTNVPQGRLNVVAGDFEPVSFLTGLTDRVLAWRDRIEKCGAVDPVQSDGDAIAALKAVRPGCSGYVRQLRRHLRVGKGGEVVLAAHSFGVKDLARLMMPIAGFFTRNPVGNRDVR
ncbi:glycosyltransferase family 2 protein [Rhizobium glycinendophyticum]|uniref:Uncharacterized protein n=1 Tax=Rhizobium glycinendophyticum TaxID=2589807 RepID=A0A504UX99_9HYPH|nr:glycosyltransferase family 2 protein [Rhizobium glycinendophyticum]TPP11381.1 hypothetical protein FJQ55_11395 [Rhizobium glycinendophyticum]